MGHELIVDTDSIQFIRTNTLSDETRLALFGWDPDPFRSKASGIIWRPKEYHVVAYKKGQPVSHVAIVRATVRVGAEQIVVGGLGSVITVPAYQGQGLAQKTLKQAIRVVDQQWHLKHGLLFCFPHRLGFYERLGWMRRNETVWVTQPSGRTAFPAHSMVQAWDSAEWPPGEMEVEGLPW